MDQMFNINDYQVGLNCGMVRNSFDFTYYGQCAKAVEHCQPFHLLQICSSLTCAHVQFLKCFVAVSLCVCCFRHVAFTFSAAVRIVVFEALVQIDCVTHWIQFVQVFLLEAWAKMITPPHY